MIRGPRAELGETSCSSVRKLETSKQRESVVQPELNAGWKVENSLEKGCASAQRLKTADHEPWRQGPLPTETSHQPSH